MSQIAIWTALTILAGASLLAGYQTMVYAQASNDTLMGNATNATNWAGNTTNATNLAGNTTPASSELNMTGKIATGLLGDGG